MVHDPQCQKYCIPLKANHVNVCCFFTLLSHSMPCWSVRIIHRCFYLDESLCHSRAMCDETSGPKLKNAKKQQH